LEWIKKPSLLWCLHKSQLGFLYPILIRFWQKLLLIQFGPRKNANNSIYADAHHDVVEEGQEGDEDEKKES